MVGGFGWSLRVTTTTTRWITLVQVVASLLVILDRMVIMSTVAVVLFYLHSFHHLSSGCLNINKLVNKSCNLMNLLTTLVHVVYLVGVQVSSTWSRSPTEAWRAAEIWGSRGLFFMTAYMPTTILHFLCQILHPDHNCICSVFYCTLLNAHRSVVFYFILNTVFVFSFFRQKSPFPFSLDLQRPSVKLRMHQNKSWLGLQPRPCWGSLQHSPTHSLDYILPFRPL